jgi:hypothetical protein
VPVASGLNFDLNGDFSIVKIVPNPADREVLISIAGTGQISEVTVVGTNGSIVRPPYTLNGNSVTIALDKLSNGIYMVRLKRNSGGYSGKILVQHSH